MLDRDDAIDILIAYTHTLYSAMLTANRVPCNEALYRLLKNPLPGDMVLELTNRNKGHDCIGTLLKVTREPVDGWNEEEDGPTPLETYWYICDVDGNEQRWFNCDFVRVLDRRVDPIREATSRGLYIWPARGE